MLSFTRRLRFCPSPVPILQQTSSLEEVIDWSLEVGPKNPGFARELYLRLFSKFPLEDLNLLQLVKAIEVSRFLLPQLQKQHREVLTVCERLLWKRRNEIVEARILPRVLENLAKSQKPVGAGRFFRDYEKNWTDFVEYYLKLLCDEKISVANFWKQVRQLLYGITELNLSGDVNDAVFDTLNYGLENLYSNTVDPLIDLQKTLEILQSRRKLSDYYFSQRLEVNKIRPANLQPLLFSIRKERRVLQDRPKSILLLLVKRLIELDFVKRVNSESLFHLYSFLTDRLPEHVCEDEFLTDYGRYRKRHDFSKYSKNLNLANFAKVEEYPKVEHGFRHLGQVFLNDLQNAVVDEIMSRSFSREELLKIMKTYEIGVEKKLLLENDSMVCDILRQLPMDSRLLDLLHIFLRRKIYEKVYGGL